MIQPLLPSLPVAFVWGHSVARHDIRPFRSPHGGTGEIKAFPLRASQSFVEGEPVMLISNALSNSDTNPSRVIGISAASSQGKTSTGRNGARPTGTLVQVYQTDDNQLFISDMFSDDGTGTLTVPDATDVGSDAGLVYNNPDWFVDVSANMNPLVRIEAVLDVTGKYLGDFDVAVGAGVSVVFRFQ